jgi:hypothetical protein
MHLKKPFARRNPDRGAAAPTLGARPMTYNREAAVAYAAIHWPTPCDDGTISMINEPTLVVAKERRRLDATGPEWLPRWQKQKVVNPDRSVGFVERFVFIHATTKEIRPSHGWKGLGDCAHYISRCVSRGGIPLATDWVPSVVTTLQGLGARTKTLCDRVSEERTKAIVATGLVRNGDIICYYDALKRELGGGYVHSAMFVDGSKGFIACHTRARFGEDWNIKPGAYRHTIIHFADDDAPFVDPFAERLAGTWTVGWRSSSFFYHFTAKGGIRWSSSRNGAPEGTGYWFATPLIADSFFIFWSKSGSVERFTFEASGTSAAGRWNPGAENEEIAMSKG